MAKKYTLFSFILLVPLCFIISCQPNSLPDDFLIEPACIAGQTQCLFETNKGKIYLLFNQEFLVAEAPFQITLNYTSTKKSIAKIQGFMEGSDMFMGKIPLFFELKNSDEMTQQFAADVLFGSCGQPEMRWNISLRMSFTDGSHQQIFTEVTSYQSAHRLLANQ